MTDIYHAKMTNFKWSMEEDDLKKLSHELGSGVKKVEMFLKNENDELVTLDMFSLQQDLPLDTVLIENFYNSKDDLVISKKRGIKILPQSKKEKLPKIKSGFYPKGQIVNLNMAKRWQSVPAGLIVHYHAGHVDNRVNSISCINSGIKNGYTYWCMEEDGIVYMPHEAYYHGYHCGTYHHRDHLGIEIMCSGKLTKGSDGVYRTWFKKVIPENEVRYVDYPGQEKGYYQIYTKAQEESLKDLCFWLKDTYPSFSFDNVLGHDEVAQGRKNDPGGSLSMSMPDFRKYLKAEYAKK